jgi:hypothetical protein
LDNFFELIIKLIILLITLIGKLFIRLFYFIKSAIQKKPATYNIEINKDSSVLDINRQSQPQPLIQGDVEQKYSLKPSVLTIAEKEFLGVLEKIIGTQYRIECQVQLSSMVHVNDSSEYFTNYHDFNRIKAKSIDFVLFNEGLNPQLAIELDDRTHSRIDRIKRDLFVDDVMKQIGLPILHVRVAYPHPYNVEQLRQEIFRSIGKNGAPETKKEL